MNNPNVKKIEEILKANVNESIITP
jgi:hypothetical protein